MAVRFEKIDPTDNLLDADDQCWNLLEYTSHGVRVPGNTNQLIGNLQKSPNATEAEMRYKQGAIQRCARMLADALGPAANQWALVPMPCSKPVDHPEHDDRLLQVLQAARSIRPDLDVRPMLETSVIREKQKHGLRLSVEEMRSTMRVAQAYCGGPYPPNIILFDDVFTRGTSFKAAKFLLANLPGVVNVHGMFIAKTVYPNPDSVPR